MFFKLFRVIVICVTVIFIFLLVDGNLEWIEWEGRLWFIGKVEIGFG